MIVLRTTLALSLLVALSACGGAEDSGPSDADVRLAEANARVAEAEARAVEAKAHLDPADGSDTDGDPIEDEPGTPTTASPAATQAESTRPGLTGLPPEPNPEPLLEADQPFTFCQTYAQSAVERYQGMELCYTGTIRQDGATLVGTGEKDTENGQTLRGAARTPMRIEGRIYDDFTVRFNFTDRGTRRVARGSASFPESGMDGGCEGYAWMDGGTFQTDAANSSGSATLFVEQNCGV